MKFLIDRRAGTRLAAWLREQGHDAAEAQGRGPDPGDRAVLAAGAAEGRVLVTIDKDFGELVFAGKARHCGLVRLPAVPAAQRIMLMEKLLTAHVDDLAKNAVVTVRGGRIRISRPPA